MLGRQDPIKLPFEIPPLIGTIVLAAILFFVSLFILRMLAHFLLLILGLFFRNRAYSDLHPIQKGATTGLGILSIVGAVWATYHQVGLSPTLIAGGILFCIYFFWFRDSEKANEG